MHEDLNDGEEIDEKVVRSEESVSGAGGNSMQL